MRLTEKERNAIVSAVRSQDPRAAIYLFGSRARDDLKGGDIDLLVISDTIDLAAKLDILVDMKSKLGEQRIDLKVLPAEKAGTDPFVQSIMPTSVRLDTLSKT